ncbi:winged helix-turn-helix domain-containing protein [Oribacterium sinus]
MKAKAQPKLFVDANTILPCPITKTTTKTTMKQKEIIKIIAENPHISAKEMAEKFNLTVDGVRYHLNKMRKAGLIRYEGSTKLGQWVIMKLNGK